VTDGDLRRGLERGIALTDLAQDLMTPSPLQIGVQESVEAARWLMLQRKVSVLPAFDNGKLCGVIQIYDC